MGYEHLLPKGWGKPSPAPASVDNGTSAWGKPVDTGPSWAESVSDAATTSSWGNTSMGQQAPNKPGKCFYRPGHLDWDCEWAGRLLVSYYLSFLLGKGERDQGARERTAL